MGAYIIGVGSAVLVLMVIYEYGWPPIELFDRWLRTEKSRRIATIIGWVLTTVFLVMAGVHFWNIARDLSRGI